jgi:hypothetical protein
MYCTGMYCRHFLTEILALEEMVKQTIKFPCFITFIPIFRQNSVQHKKNRYRGNMHASKLGTDVDCDCGLTFKNCLAINDTASGLIACSYLYLLIGKQGKEMSLPHI